MNQIDINSREYPYLLKQINDPPRVLYYKGNWDSEIFKETLGVVGSRRMTKYGQTITKELVTDIAGAGITIVSGFMYGIDAQAHGASLESNGRTIAVMPCGIERIHPEYQSELYKRIIDTNGLVVSEYPGDSPPALWTYPRRNRIIVGLSSRLLVVEAGLKSGALITARIANKYNKKIFAVPGPLTSSVSMGTSLLIKQGASILLKSGDILDEYGIEAVGEPYARLQIDGLNKSQRPILDLLSQEPMSIDEITRSLKRTTAETGAELTRLCLRKFLTFDDGKYYTVRNGQKRR